MASLSGNSTTSSKIQSSASESGLKQKQQMDERKRKRMESNRESARRSRMKKQKHLDDLTAQIARLRTENHQILNTINVSNQQFVAVEAENSVLRAQMSELSQRLESLNEMVNYLNTLGGFSSLEDDELGFVGNSGICEGHFGNFDGYPKDVVGCSGLGYVNHPIMASTNVLYN